MSRDELYMFLGGGELPPVLAAAVGNTTATAPEVIHSRPDRKRRRGQSDTDTPDTITEDADHEGNNGNNGDNTDNPNSYGYNADTENTNLESEGN